MKTLILDTLYWLRVAATLPLFLIAMIVLGIMEPRTEQDEED
jgi:hypothetical protein